MPTIVTHTIKASGGDYTSLAAWEAAQQRDLVAVDQIAVAECYAFEDTTAVTIDGWTTDATCYIEVRAAQGAGTAMRWLPSTEAYTLKVSTAAHVFTINEEYVRVQRIQLWGEFPAFSRNAIEINGTQIGRIEITGCTIRGTLDQFIGNGIYYNKTSAPGAQVVVMANNLIYGWKSSVNSGIGIHLSQYGRHHIFNNTILSCATGSFSTGIALTSNLRNNLASGSGIDYGGTFTTSSNNASSDATASGSNSRTNQTFTFVNAAGGDYRLAGTDTGARTFGTDLSADITYPFSTDMIGTTRLTPWDIGAHESGIHTQTHTIKSSGGDYTSLGAWEAAQQQDLVANKRIAQAECYPMLDVNGVQFNGWTTSEQRYIRVFPAPGAEAKIPWSTNAYRLEGANYTAMIENLEAWVFIERIQICNTRNYEAGASAACIYPAFGMEVGMFRLDGLSLRKTGTLNTGSSTLSLIVCRAPGTMQVTIRNCFGTGGENGLYWGPNFGEAKGYIYNNTFVNALRYNFLVENYGNASSSLDFRNNLGVGGGIGDFLNIDGTIAPASDIRDQNASADNTALADRPGGGTLRNRTFTFINSASGDYHLANSDTGARGIGVDLSSGISSSFNIDFDGLPRRRNSWDIGADQNTNQLVLMVPVPTGKPVVLSSNSSRGRSMIIRG